MLVAGDKKHTVIRGVVITGWNWIHTDIEQECYSREPSLVGAAGIEHRLSRACGMSLRRQPRANRHAQRNAAGGRSCANGADP